jgi:hypothetical protein
VQSVAIECCYGLKTVELDIVLREAGSSNCSEQHQLAHAEKK